MELINEGGVEEDQPAAPRQPRQPNQPCAETMSDQEHFSRTLNLDAPANTISRKPKPSTKQTFAVAEVG